MKTILLADKMTGTPNPNLLHFREEKYITTVKSYPKVSQSSSKKWWVTFSYSDLIVLKLSSYFTKMVKVANVKRSCIFLLTYSHSLESWMQSVWLSILNARLTYFLASSISHSREYWRPAANRYFPSSPNRWEESLSNCKARVGVPYRNILLIL